MGYGIKLQKVERPTNRSYYVNLPVVLAEAMNLKKGEDLEWILEDKNTLLLVRRTKQPPRKSHAP
jgi:bifunctional DNA-binding transcriptional regulator/antitoxin component of YhaV-PrlF toxin-antitoxin module